MSGCDVVTIGGTVSCSGNSRNQYQPLTPSQVWRIAQPRTTSCNCILQQTAAHAGGADGTELSGTNAPWRSRHWVVAVVAAACSSTSARHGGSTPKSRRNMHRSADHAQRTCCMSVWPQRWVQCLYSFRCRRKRFRNGSIAGAGTCARHSRAIPKLLTTKAPVYLSPALSIVKLALNKLCMLVAGMAAAAAMLVDLAAQAGNVSAKLR